MTTRKPVIVVGGGVAGLTAAVRLASRDVPVLLLEQRPRPGGRTYSFRDTVSGEIIDNGQHLLIAGYRRTLDLLDTLGVLDKVEIQRQPTLLFHHPVKGFRRFSIPRLPAPWNLLSGILAFDLLSSGDRLRLLRAGAALRGGDRGERGATVAGWLDLQRQSAEACRCFWDPLTLAIMNEHPERAAAKPFLRALQMAFLGSPDGAALAMPRVGLSELFVDPALVYLGSRGMKVRCGSDVVRLLADSDRVHGVLLRNGEEVRGGAVILALPWYGAAALLKDVAPVAFDRQGIGASPIVSIHLWFPEDFMPEESVGLIGRRIHWLFNRRRINREKGAGGHLSAVISAAREFVGWGTEDILSLATEDIRTVYPLCPATPLRGVVIREKRATPSLTPEAEHLRPGTVTAFTNLFLAGDWTDTGLPATIEGAVQSAERCVELFLRAGQLHI